GREPISRFTAAAAGQSFTERARRAPQPLERANQDVDEREREHEGGHRHLDHVPTKMNEHIALIAKQKVRRESADAERRQRPKPETHQLPPAGTARKRFNEPLKSGLAGATSRA